VVYLEPLATLEPFKHGTHGRVFNLRDILGILDPRIHHTVLMLEKRREITTTDVAILVDSGREYHATVFAKPGGIVRTSPEEGNPEWRPAYYHIFLPA
jgi:hypothetical protein